MGSEADDTVRLSPPPRAGRPVRGSATRRNAWLGGVAGLILAGAVGWTAFRLLAPVPAPLPSPAPVVALATPPAAPVLQAFPVLTEAEIADHRAAWPTVLQLAENPRVFVLDFPDLASQGMALNRVAALVEKADLPRDHVLSDTEMAAVLVRSGETAETYYYGHDYRGSDLERFFTLAAREGLVLNEGERWVSEQLARARALSGPGEIALISVAAPGPRMDESARRTILHHEVGHGYDFTVPFYAAHVRRVWAESFTEADRAAFRSFLAREGYDVTNEDLVAGEMQAYLLFTPDERFFAAQHLGLSPQRVEQLRALVRNRAPLP
ncbi:hypothetical protein [Roseomonas sp. BN140053]|uniref:hypothetical protein n=1 Tax=Roseomonas sp. BN140053 TaxID=3391898 RepID=UPI0039E83BBA